MVAARSIRESLKQLKVTGLLGSCLSQNKVSVEVGHPCRCDVLTPTPNTRTFTHAHAAHACARTRTHTVPTLLPGALPFLGAPGELHARKCLFTTPKPRSLSGIQSQPLCFCAHFSLSSGWGDPSGYKATDYPTLRAMLSAPSSLQGISTHGQEQKGQKQGMVELLYLKAQLTGPQQPHSPWLLTIPTPHSQAVLLSFLFPVENLF